MKATEAFLAHPSLAAVLWALLHTADYSLTLVGARMYRPVAHIIGFESYELNPLFREPVERQRWLAPRFLLTLVGIALMLWLLLALVAFLPDYVALTYLAGILLGVLVFTRLVVIGGHLMNVWIFHQLRRQPDLVSGHIRYGLPFSLRLSALRFVVFGAVLATAALLTGHPWLTGGVVGCGLVAAKQGALASLRRRGPGSSQRT